MNIKPLPCLRLFTIAALQLIFVQIAGAQVQITTTPALSPTFEAGITDYVVPSGADTSVQVSVTVPANVKVSVDGQLFHSTSFTTQVNNLNAGQSFKIVVAGLVSAQDVQVGFTTTYYVRRLPSDFPMWSTVKAGAPQSEYYIFEQDIATNFSGFKNYTIVADNNGTPMWWYRSNDVPIDGKLLAQGRLGWIAWFPGFAEVHSLNGAVTHTITPVGGRMDNH